MKMIKALLLAVISLFFLSLPAWGENWVEVTADGRNQAFYDSDSAFIDTNSGLVIVEMAAWLPEDDNYTYIMQGFDCSRWQFYVIALSTPEGWKYDVNREFEVKPITDPTSPISKTARWACDSNEPLPLDTLPFNFQLSR
ncbi:MAG: hypothetical protein ACTSU8_05090 [Alphaproteobacteria bacterium]